MSDFHLYISDCTKKFYSLSWKHCTYSHTNANTSNVQLNWLSCSVLFYIICYLPLRVSTAGAFHLLGFTSDNHSIALLSGAKRATLKEANSISKIFRFLKKEFTSFLNYDIFECLVEHFQLDRDQENMKYPEKLKAYVKSSAFLSSLKSNQLWANIRLIQ